MAAVANRVQSTTQQIGAETGSNPIEQRSLQQVRLRVPLIFFDPRPDHCNLSFGNSCLLGVPPSFFRSFGQVVDDGGNRFPSRNVTQSQGFASCDRSAFGKT
jgi:hypothetical protein